MEQAARHGRSQETVHRDTARGEPENSDVVRIASKCGDVALDPLQGRDLVHVRVICLGFARTLAAQGGEGEEPEASQAVIGGHQDNAVFGELDPRGVGRRTRSSHEPASIDPDHHGELRPWRRAGGTPDVQVQTIFGRHPRRRRTGRRRRAEPSLHAVRPEFRRLAHTGPWRRRLRRPPPQAAYGRRREGDAFEGRDAVVNHALQLAALHSHHRRLCGVSANHRRQAQQGGANHETCACHFVVSPPSSFLSDRNFDIRPATWLLFKSENGKWVFPRIPTSGRWTTVTSPP